MFTHPDYLMVNVSDMGRSVAFYRDTLGLSLKFESPGWSEFTCSLGFSVQSLDSTCQKLQAGGVVFVMPPTERADEGIRLAVCLEPDGLPISFAEPLPRAR